MFQRFFKRPVSAGYGLAILMVWVLSLLLIATSLQLLTGPTLARYLGTSSQENLAARQLAWQGLDVVSTDIQTRLDAGQTIDTSYTYPLTTVSIPNDPASLGTLNNAIGSYSASVTQARGDSFLVKIVATVGGATVNLYQLLQMDGHSFDCNVVESKVLSGNISALTNSELIAYAQHNCMVKNTTVTAIAPSTTGTSATSCQDLSGSGTLNMNVINCAMTATGTYPTVLFKPTGTSVQAGTSMTPTEFRSLPTSGSRTLHIPGTIGDYSIIGAMAAGIPKNDAKKSPYDHTFILNDVTRTNDITFLGGNGNDVFYVHNLFADIYLNDGNNIAIIYGSLGNGNTGNNWIGMGDDGAYGAVNDTGTNRVYVNEINTVGNTYINNYSTGSGTVYFNKIIGSGTVNMLGSSNNDVFSCGVSFTGAGAGNETCQSIAATVGLNISGMGGSDIISLDMSLPSDTNLYGNDYFNNPTATETTANIIYSKGCSGYVTIKTNNTASLVISGGNRGADCAIDGQGGNSVLLIKSGTTSSGTITNFGRTLTY